MSDERVLYMEHITKEFPGVVALSDVNFSCQKGEVHALMGENGAGKSTLIKLLSGDSKPTSGEIFFFGKKFEPTTPLEAMQIGITIIYQELNLIPNLNTSENIFFGREPRKGLFNDFKKMRHDAVELLKTLDVELDMDIAVSQMSVAQQQMVEIAKALSMKASLIVMDEPTSSLTTAEIESLYKVVRKLKMDGVTIIFITHHLDEIFEIADRVTVLKDGQHVGTKDIADITEETLIQMMVGRKLEEIYPPKDSHPGDVVLEVKDLTQSNVLRDISFNVRKGEIVSLAGLMGAGRTELAQAIFGETKIDTGEVWVNGDKVTIKHPSDGMKAGMGFVTEDRKTQGLVLEMSVRENVSLCLLKNICKAGFIDMKKEQEVTEEYINSLKIKTPTQIAKVNNLSGGNQQKVVLAKWLACDVEIIILDEPTRGIDVGAKMEIYTLMRKLVSEGKAILMISSELPEVIGMSDRVLVMREGRITGELSCDELAEDTILKYAMGG